MVSQAQLSTTENTGWNSINTSVECSFQQVEYVESPAWNHSLSRYKTSIPDDLTESRPSTLRVDHLPWERSFHPPGTSSSPQRCERGGSTTNIWISAQWNIWNIYQLSIYGIRFQRAFSQLFTRSFLVPPFCFADGNQDVRITAHASGFSGRDLQLVHSLSSFYGTSKLGPFLLFHLI